MALDLRSGAVESTSGKRTPHGKFIWTLLDVKEAEPRKDENGQLLRNPDGSAQKPRLQFIFKIKKVLAIDSYPDSAWINDREIMIDTKEDKRAYAKSLIGTEHWEWATWSLAPNAKLTGWLQGMLKKTIKRDDSLNADLIINRDYEVVYGEKTYPAINGGKETISTTIISIRPDGSDDNELADLDDEPDATPVSATEKPAPWEKKKGEDPEGFDDDDE